MAGTAKLALIPANQSNVGIEPGDILTTEELAERLKVPVSWVYKHVGRLPILRCGRYLRFSWPEVCAWLRSAKT